MKRIFLYIALCLIYISCSTDSTSINNAETSLLIYYVENDQIWAYNYDDEDEQLIYESTDKKLVSFDYLEKKESTYFIFFEELDTAYHYRTTLAKLDKKGDLIEIYKYDTREGEGFSSFVEIYVSDDEKYLALVGAHYESGFFTVYDLVNGEFIQFEGKQYTDYVSFLTWGPDNKSIYIQAHDYLVLYNLMDKTINMLDTPNIRDYLSEDYLLSVGYVGKRFNYSQSIGIDYPQYLNWNESGNTFVYLKNDSMFLYDVENENSEYLFYMNDYKSYYKMIDVIWNDYSKADNVEAVFTDNDIIVSFDSTTVQSIPALNDSIYRDITKSQSISYIRYNWNHITDSWERYFFRKEINAEKIHVTEFDFHTWYYAVRYTPRFWFLVVTLENEDFNAEDFISTFKEYIEKYQNTFEYFKTLNYPQSLNDKKQEYDELHSQDLQFQQLFLDFYMSQDTVTFKEDVYNLLGGVDSQDLDEVFLLLNDPEHDENFRLIEFYRVIHNRFLNYYGHVINKDIENIKDELLIEELSDDWLCKTGALYTMNYLKYNIYEY